MRCVARFVIALITTCYFSTAFANNPVGNWTVLDDKTGKERAIVKLDVTNGVLSGKIVQVYPQPGDTGKCTKCPDAFKNRPIKGLKFLWGLTEKGHDVWTGGQILDAKNGKIYNAKITVKGGKLYVRGYVGLSMLGRTQVWIRANDA